MTNCTSCEGEKISSKCIIWEGVELPFDSFERLIEYLYATSKKKNSVDIKTLSEKTELTDDEVFQILIDAEVKRKYESSKTTQSISEQCSTLNVSSLDGCTTCSKTLCEKLDLMVREISKLKLEVEQLKSQL